MVVRRKPTNVEEFIQEGGAPPAQAIAVQATSEPEPKAGTKKDEKGLKLRLPESLLKRVDDAVAQRRPAPSRHQWILEAIYEKLDRETKELE